MSRPILVVDDDPSIRETFEHHLTRSGHQVETAGSAEQALHRLAELEPALVITDLRMPGMDGLELLRRARKAIPDLDVLVITAHEDMRSAMEAMKAGAYDYLVKPLDLDQVDLLIERCLQDQRLKRRVEQLSAAAAEPYTLDQMIGRNPRMIEIYKLIGTLTRHRAPVLIRGETGTGKEVIARAIHFNSADAQEPFIAVNCTALPETLLESELFGHVRGAFTGAVTGRKGRFELAGAGTIFLDEIGDVSPAFQAELLRVVEDHEFYPVGSERPRRSEARVMAATNRSIEDRIASGHFREDLYFRLKVVEIWVPPLRERSEDIPLLAAHLLARIAREMHKDVRLIDDAAMRVLTAYDWPGNVRELENTLTRAVVTARGPALTKADLAPGPAAARQNTPVAGDDDTLATAERLHVEGVLERTGGNKRKAARILGISRGRLDRIIARHGLLATERDHPGPDS